MFSNISYQDKEAFFSLLDEYFASRPHLLNGNGSGNGYGASSPPALASMRSNSGRSMPPMAPSSSSRPPAPPMSPPPSANNQQQPDMATKMVMSGFKLGASGARKGLGMLSKNDQAMNALGRAGAAGMIRSAQAGLGGKEQQQQQQQQQQYQEQPPSPTTTMTATRTTVAAPPRRNGSGPGVQQSQGHVQAGPRGKAVYDYSSGDSGDLSVQSGQIVNIVEKTSADWWTCEDGSGRQGLVPSSYLQEI